MSSMNIPVMTVGAVIDELAKLYVSMINKGLSYSTIPSPFLWGPPGVGKSDAVGELAVKIEAKTGKSVKVTDVRLLLFSPIDLRGVPVADETRKFTDWLKPRILDLDESEDTVNILFLDELSAAPQSVQAAAYQLTLNRAIGEHRLPDNTIVMAAGNRTTDRAVAFKMPSALANRMMHYEIKVDYTSWSSWAITEGNVHPLVLGFLSYDADKLYLKDKNLDDLAFPTPRSWMFVSNILQTLQLDDVDHIGKYHALISGCIGTGAAVEFIAWCKVYKDLPMFEDIVEGRTVVFPATPDALYALIASMTTKVVSAEQEGGAGLTVEEVDNICKFCARMPADYATSFYLNIVAVLRLKLMKSPTFVAWGKKHKRLLENIGYSI